MRNEPAFPRPFSWDESPSGIHSGDRIEYHAEQRGMTMRDYFAAAALQGLIAARFGDSQRAEHLLEVLSLTAYKAADAMLAERSK